jgi:hypothetical protein
MFSALQGPTSKIWGHRDCIRAVDFIVGSADLQIQNNLNLTCNFKGNYYEKLTKTYKVEVKWINERRGKGVFAKTNIYKGEIVWTEEPLISFRNITNEVRTLSYSEERKRERERERERQTDRQTDRQTQLPLFNDTYNSYLFIFFLFVIVKEYHSCLFFLYAYDTHTKSVEWEVTFFLS